MKTLQQFLKSESLSAGKIASMWYDQCSHPCCQFGNIISVIINGAEFEYQVKPGDTVESINSIMKGIILKESMSHMVA